MIFTVISIVVFHLNIKLMSRYKMENSVVNCVGVELGLNFRCLLVCSDILITLGKVSGFTSIYYLRK